MYMIKINVKGYIVPGISIGFVLFSIYKIYDFFKKIMNEHTRELVFIKCELYQLKNNNKLLEFKFTNNMNIMNNNVIQIEQNIQPNICIVENVKDNFKDFEDFFNSCNRRTMISKLDLKTKWWDKFPKYKPFVINFLYAHSLPTPKPTLGDLIKLKIFADPMSLTKGFTKLTNEQFNDLINFAYSKK